MILKKIRSFHQYSWNSELATTWLVDPIGALLDNYVLHEIIRIMGKYHSREGLFEKSTSSKICKKDCWLLATNIFLGWRQPVLFTNFLAETVFWEYSFFIRNYKKITVFEKFSNQYFVFFWKHFIVVSCLGSVAK